MTIGYGVEIVFEDEYILICKKPAGLATQTKQTRATDLVHILKKYLYMKQAVKSEPYLGVIHRLDQPVSGLLVFAKDANTAAMLSQSMQKNDFAKHYAAILTGTPKSAKGQLVNYLAKKDAGNISQVVDTSHTGAKKAILNYQVLPQPTSSDMAIFPGISMDRESENTYIHIQLETGRHHQIRVQTSHIGCPIVGDTKYGPSASDNKWTQIALCAYRLDLTHPITKKSLSYSLI